MGYRAFRRRRRNPILAWIRANRLIVLIAAGCLVLLIVGVVFIVNSSNSQKTEPAPPVVSEKTQGTALTDEDLEQQKYQEQIQNGEIDPDVLAGLLGEDSSNDDNTVDAEKNAKKMIGMVVSSEARMRRVTDGFGKKAQSLVGTQIDDYRIYVVADNANQQIQDVRSMINQGCDAIVVAGVSDYTFEIVYSLTKKAGVPLIAIEAPAGTAPEVNIIESGLDPAAYVKYISENIPQGTVIYFGKDAESEASKSAEKALSSLGARYVGSAYKTSAGYDAMVISLFAKKPAVVLAQEDMATEILKTMAIGKTVPDYFCADATVGLLKTWYALRTTGYQVETPGATQEEAPVVTTYTSEKGQIVSRLHASADSLGEAACLFATGFAEGKKLPEESYVYHVQSPGILTNENMAVYIGRTSQDAETEPVCDSTDNAQINTLFQ